MQGIPGWESTLVAVTCVYLLGSILYFALLRPTYSHMRHTISELGETGSPNARIVSWCVFLPVGLACLVLGAMVEGAGMIGLSIGIGYVGGALFPCDADAPLLGSWKTSLHNLAGSAEYVGGAAALAAAGYSALTMLIIVIMVILGWPSPIRGGVQRVAEVILFAFLGWQVWTGSGGGV